MHRIEKGNNAADAGEPAGRPPHITTLQAAAFARFFRKKSTIMWIKCLKAVAIIAGTGLIAAALLTLADGLAHVPDYLLKALSRVGRFLLPFLLDLMLHSLLYLWQPIAIYLTISVLTRGGSRAWRDFWLTVALAASFLYFMRTAQHLTWKEYHLAPLLGLQSYLLLLWLVPREVWNLIGLAASGTLGLIILILPDLPTAFDDFGMFGAILAFVLGYLNAVAGLTQRLADYIRAALRQPRRD